MSSGRLGPPGCAAGARSHLLVLRRLLRCCLLRAEHMGAAGAAEQEVTGRPWIALQALPRVQAALVLLAEGEVILGEAECPLGHSHRWWLPRGCGVLTGLFLACC